MYFQVISKLGKAIAISPARWDLIIHTKHPEITGKERKVQEALQEPQKILARRDGKTQEWRWVHHHGLLHRPD